MSGPMRVFVYATGADTAGQGVRIQQAFARHAPDWPVDALAMSTNYMAYPEQHGGRVHERVRLARRLYDAADVIHVRNSLDGWRALDRGQGKPVLLHHHGTNFRTNHAAIAAGARIIGAVQVASTIDLTLLEPDVAWLPAPFNLAELAAIRERVYQPSARIRIAHAPTARKIKSTAVFLAACERLAERYPIDVDVIEGRPWAECLDRKARADIYYDQLILGYGCNAIEAWAMGIPVVAGVADDRVKRRMVSVFGRLPFVAATEATLEVALERLIRSRRFRAEAASRGREHALRFHDETKVVAQLQSLYSAAGPTRMPARPTTRLALEQRRRAILARRLAVA